MKKKSRSPLRCFRIRYSRASNWNSLHRFSLEQVESPLPIWKTHSLVYTKRHSSRILINWNRFWENNGKRNRQLFSLLFGLFVSSVKKTNNNIVLKIEEWNQMENSLEIANQFNEFFNNTASDIISRIPNSSTNQYYVIGKIKLSPVADTL